MLREDAGLKHPPAKFREGFKRGRQTNWSNFEAESKSAEGDRGEEGGGGGGGVVEPMKRQRRDTREDMHALEGKSKLDPWYERGNLPGTVAAA